MGRETVRNKDQLMNLSDGDITSQDGGYGRPAGIKKNKMKGKKAGKNGQDANACNSCEQVCNIF